MAFKQRKFRNKISVDDDEGEDGPPTIRPPQHQPKKEQTAGAAKSGSIAEGLWGTKGNSKKESKGSKLNLLSFEDDGDDPGFIPKKDSKKDKQRQSKLARAPALTDLPTDTAPQTLRSTAGEYTAERLKELQRNAISFSAARLAGSGSGAPDGAPPSGSGAGGAAEPVLKLSGSFKPAGAPKDDRFTLPGSSIALVQPAAAAEDAMPLPPPPRPGVGPAGQGPSGASAAAAAAADEDDDGDDGGIPDQQTILAAKAKRERLRQAHLAPDYIPLSGMGLGMGRLKGAAAAGPGWPRGGSVGPGGSGSAAEGGGAQGDGSDSEAEAEDTMRIRFSGKEAGRAGRDKSQYNQAMGGDDDEEAFAQEQLRKALRLQQVSGAAGPVPSAPGIGAAAAATAASAAATAAGTAAGYATHMPPSSAPPAVFASGTGSRAAAINAAGDAAVASLAEGLRRLQASHKQVQQNARRTADNLTSSLARVEGLEAELRQAGDKYLFMQKLKAYVADLCDCLQVKSAIVEELEDSRLELMEDRAQAARTAAANADRDLMAPAEAAVAAAMAALGRGAGAAAAASAADSAARDAEDALLDEEGPVEVDEFGRNVNLQRRRELEARAAERKKLLAAEGERLAAAQSGAIIQPLAAEGESADEQVQSSSRYDSRYGEIMEAGGTVFADTDEEFASIDVVKRRLEEWKARYPKDYTNAYMHLSNPALFAPYVRLELLRWDPLYGTPEGSPYKGFDSLDWYGQLFEYGMNAPDGTAAMSNDDPDSELVPQLVRKLVLPLALHWIERCWDVRNAAHTRAVAALSSELLVYVPAEEERMVELLSGVRGSLEAAVEGCALSPWPPAVLACSPLAARVLFRRFRLALRLLHAISAFEGLLARGLLTGLALGRLVSAQLMPYLRAAAAGGDAAAMPFAISTVEAVAQGLHPDWFAAGPLSEGAVFQEHVVLLGRALEQQQQQQRGSADAAARAGLAIRLAWVMARIGDSERSNRLAAAFGIRNL